MEMILITDMVKDEIPVRGANKKDKEILNKFLKAGKVYEEYDKLKDPFDRINLYTSLYVLNIKPKEFDAAVTLRNILRRLKGSIFDVDAMFNALINNPFLENVSHLIIMKLLNDLHLVNSLLCK